MAICFAMCGRATYKLTWEEIVALYRLTLDQPPANARAMRYRRNATLPATYSFHSLFERRQQRHISQSGPRHRQGAAMRAYESAPETTPCVVFSLTEFLLRLA